MRSPFLPIIAQRSLLIRFPFRWCTLYRTTCDLTATSVAIRISALPWVFIRPSQLPSFQYCCLEFTCEKLTFPTFSSFFLREPFLLCVPSCRFHPEPVRFFLFAVIAAELWELAPLANSFSSAYPRTFLFYFPPLPFSLWLLRSNKFHL